MELTVVLPAKDEEDNLAPLVVDLLMVMDRTGLDGEVLVVDDGSGDGTAAVLDALAGPRVRSLRFPVNRGRAHAIAAGFAEARAWAVVVMDSDRQYDPADIPALLATLRAGADVANGVRTHRADSPMRRLVSSVYNLVVMRAALGVGNRDANSGLKAFRTSALPRLAFDPSDMRRGHRFLVAWAIARGLRVVDVPVSHRDRQAGRSYIRAVREARLTLADLVVFRRAVRGALQVEQRPAAVPVEP